MLVDVQRCYWEGHRGGRRPPELRGRLHSDEVGGVRVLNLWPLHWNDVLTHGHGLRPQAQLWRYEVRRVAYVGHMLIWGIEKIGHGPKARWFSQTWEVLWLPESVLLSQGGKIEGALPAMIEATYGPPTDPENPFA